MGLFRERERLQGPRPIYSIKEMSELFRECEHMVSDLKTPLEELTGTVEHIIFQNAESGYSVVRLKAALKAELITVVGMLPTIRPGEKGLFTGFWRHNPTHGREFFVKSWNLLAPADIDALQKYLGSGVIRGIGPEFAKRIIEKFKEKSLDILEGDPEKLLEIEGIGPKKLEGIKASWHEHKSVRNLLISLSRFEISFAYAMRIFKIYGNDAAARIEENPYRLAQDIPGIGFKTADKIASHMGFDRESPLRIASGIEYLLLEEASHGHVCFPLKEFIPLAKTILEVDESKIGEAIEKLKEEGRLVIQEKQEEPFLWLKGLYLTEAGIVKEFARLKEFPCTLRQIDVSQAVIWVEKKAPYRPC